MRIKVKPVGIIRRFADEQEMEAEGGTTSQDLISLLRIPAELKMIAIVNGKGRDLNAELLDGDAVTLVTLLTGG